jgi:hypothetical protein
MTLNCPEHSEQLRSHRTCGEYPQRIIPNEVRDLAYEVCVTLGWLV